MVSFKFSNSKFCDIINNINFFLYYNRGVYFSNQWVKENYFKPINSLGLKLNYSFKIFSINHNSRIDCPSFDN